MWRERKLNQDCILKQYRFGSLFSGNIDISTLVDRSMDPSQTHCGGVLDSLRDSLVKECSFARLTVCLYISSKMVCHKENELCLNRSWVVDMEGIEPASLASRPMLPELLVQTISRNLWRPFCERENQCIHMSYYQLIIPLVISNLVEKSSRKSLKLSWTPGTDPSKVRIGRLLLLWVVELVLNEVIHWLLVGMGVGMHGQRLIGRVTAANHYRRRPSREPDGVW